MVWYVVTESEKAGKLRYGIAAVQGDDRLDWIVDAAPSLGETVRLAAMLQQNAVSIAHFRDVVQDYIAERD